jgi:alpha-D-ribose 1-methylphosphonate 5-triphosphate synthase subunit PhnG
MTPAIDPTKLPPTKSARQIWMAILARASAAELRELLQDVAELPAFRVLRGPEAGLVMVRGRAGGGGAPFNLGEMSVTRCTVRDAEGQIGHAYISGRDAAQAELAARIDAALQSPERHDQLQAAVIATLAARQEAARAESARKAAATRVQFFTLATMRS